MLIVFCCIIVIVVVVVVVIVVVVVVVVVIVTLIPSFQRCNPMFTIQIHVLAAPETNQEDIYKSTWFASVYIIYRFKQFQNLWL